MPQWIQALRSYKSSKFFPCVGMGNTFKCYALKLIARQISDEALCDHAHLISGHMLLLDHITSFYSSLFINHPSAIKTQPMHQMCKIIHTEPTSYILKIKIRIEFQVHEYTWNKRYSVTYGSSPVIHRVCHSSLSALHIMLSHHHQLFCWIISYDVYYIT